MPHSIGDLPDQGDDRGPRDAPFADADSLGEIGQVRRGVESGPVAPGRQHRMDHGGRGPLAVGPRDMTDPEPVLGMVEQRQRLRHALQPQVDLGAAKIVDEVETLLIGTHDTAVHGQDTSP